MSELIPIRDVIGFSESLTFKMIESSSHYFPLQLKILIQARKDVKTENEKLAINLLALTGTTAFIESILYENICKIFEGQKYQQGDYLKLNMVKYFETAVSNATFKDYEVLSKELLGCSLNKFTDNDTWEGILILFTIRNQIVHGKDFSIEYTDADKDTFTGEYSKNYRKAIDFLAKKKLIDKEDLSLSKLLNDRATDYFTELAKSFFNDVTKNMSNEFNTTAHTSLNYVRYLFEQK